MLQETYSFSTIKNLWEMERGGNIIRNHKNNGSKGVAIVFKRDFKYCLDHFEADDSVHFLITNIQINGRGLCLANLYGSNSESSDFFFC